EAGIRDVHVTGVQTCALPIFGDVTPRLVVCTPEVSGEAKDAGGYDRQAMLRRHPDVVVEIREAPVDRRERRSAVLDQGLRFGSQRRPGRMMRREVEVAHQ